MPEDVKKFNVNMLRKRWTITIVAFFLILFVNCTATSAQIKAESLRPSLVAIQVESLNLSIEWYMR